MDFGPDGPAPEAELRRQGYVLLGGTDEAGRGPLAGPVVAAAVVLAPSWEDPGVDDSKKLSPKRREELAVAIKSSVTAWGIGMCQAGEVDSINIHQASLLAMARAVAALPRQPEFLLVDGKFTPKVDLPCRALVKGDSRSRCIAAASILAKVERDEIMLGWHEKYPRYNFAANKGYGTAEHKKALEAHGPCPIHRKSFGPVAQMSLGLTGA